MSGLWQGIKLFKDGRYAEALGLLLPLAEAGNLEACLLVSRMYFAGNGVPKDREQYAYWLCRAADQGDPASRSKIKKMIREGTLPEGLAVDPLVVVLKKKTG